jgi:UDP-N-acetylmuramate--alanine ligase
MRIKRGIAVGGTHGKTTTTSIISSIFLHADFDPTIAVGGRLKLIESTNRLGAGPWMVAEADESDGSFARLSPEISIITNIDSDHLDHFGSFENLQAAFKNFALSIPYYGSAIVMGDDPKTREIFKNFTKKIIFYGENDNNDFILKKEGEIYSVSTEGEKIGELKLAVPGVHNALNALAACIATHAAGVPWNKCFQGANQYDGVDRRFQKITEKNNIQIFDDYAHHPTEIKATVSAVGDLKAKGEFHLIYEPHRFTRTRDCWEEYKSCFNGVDKLYLAPIYTAGETPIEGVTSQNLAKKINVPTECFEDEEEFLKDLSARLKPGDVVMTMGAGQVWKLGLKLQSLLEA